MMIKHEDLIARSPCIKILQELQGHSDSIHDICLLPPNHLLSCSDENEIRLFNLSCGTCEKILECKTTVTALVHWKEYNMVLAINIDGELLLYEVMDDYGLNLRKIQKICEGKTRKIIQVDRSRFVFYCGSVFRITMKFGENKKEPEKILTERIFQQTKGFQEIYRNQFSFWSHDLNTPLFQLKLFPDIVAILELDQRSWASQETLLDRDIAFLNWENEKHHSFPPPLSLTVVNCFTSFITLDKDSNKQVERIIVGVRNQQDVFSKGSFVILKYPSGETICSVRMPKLCSSLVSKNNHLLLGGDSGCIWYLNLNTLDRNDYPIALKKIHSSPVHQLVCVVASDDDTLTIVSASNAYKSPPGIRVSEINTSNSFLYPFQISKTQDDFVCSKFVNSDILLSENNRTLILASVNHSNQGCIRFYDLKKQGICWKLDTDPVLRLFLLKNRLFFLEFGMQSEEGTEVILNLVEFENESLGEVKKIFRKIRRIKDFLDLVQKSNDSFIVVTATEVSNNLGNGILCSKLSLLNLDFQAEGDRVLTTSKTLFQKNAEFGSGCCGGYSLGVDFEFEFGSKARIQVCISKKDSNIVYFGGPGTFLRKIHVETGKLEEEIEVYSNTRLCIISIFSYQPVSNCEEVVVIANNRNEVYMIQNASVIKKLFLVGPRPKFQHRYHFYKYNDSFLLFGGKKSFSFLDMRTGESRNLVTTLNVVCLFKKTRDRNTLILSSMDHRVLSDEDRVKHHNNVVSFNELKESDICLYKLDETERIEFLRGYIIYENFEVKFSEGKFGFAKFFLSL